jgi:hypothetical protein
MYTRSYLLGGIQEFIDHDTMDCVESMQ